MEADLAQDVAALLRVRERRRDEQRRGRSAARDRRAMLPGARSGSTSTRPTAGSRCSPSAGRRATRRDRARRLDHARPAQVALPAVRVRLPARARRGRLSAGVPRSPRTTCAKRVASSREVNFSDLGLQLSRMARAFKVWVSVQYFGLDAFRRAIERSLDLAERARRRVEASDRLELAAPAVARHRLLPPRASTRTRSARSNARLVSALEESGLGLVSSTRLKGRYTIRMCVMSHTTGRGDVERVLDFLEEADVADARRRPPARYERHPDVTRAGSGAVPRPGSRFSLLESTPDAGRRASGRPRRAAQDRGRARR